MTSWMPYPILRIGGPDAVRILLGRIVPMNPATMKIIFIPGHQFLSIVILLPLKSFQYEIEQRRPWNQLFYRCY